MARSFLEAKKYLEENVSKNQNQWKWSNLHQNVYKNTVLSKIGLSSLAERRIGQGGNYNTPDASRFSLSSLPKNGIIESTYGGVYKEIFSLGTDKTKSMFSISGGINENPFSRSYMDLLSDFIKGKLIQMRWGQDIKDVKHETLILTPDSDI